MNRTRPGWRVIERPGELAELYRENPELPVSINGREPRPLSQDWNLVVAGGTPLIIALCALGVWDVSVEDGEDRGITWRDATPEELQRWPTLAMLRQHFTDARLVPVSTGSRYRKYEIAELKGRA